MKKNWILISISFICYAAIILASCFCLVIPGLNKIKEANNIKDLTYEEKTQLIDEVNQKYITLEKETVEKYNPSINEVNKKYDALEQSTKEKYDELEKTIKEEYDKKENEIKKSISNLNVLKNKEFFANGLSKKYYELSDQISSLNDKKADLFMEEHDKLNDNDIKENKELSTIEKNRKSELKTIDDNKKAELNGLNSQKDIEIKKINNQSNNRSLIKSEGIFKIIVAFVIVLIPVLYVILVFNRLTHLSNAVSEKWSQIAVLLKQRTDLIPNIVETIKGFSNHEKATLTKVTKARNQALKATTKEEEIIANKNLTSVINRLFILQEEYPELKANTNFMDLQYTLRNLENDISISRQEYNKAVLKYQNKLEMFPSNIIASLFNFKEELFFDADEKDLENPTINFE